ncbi:MAG: hypothetical protein F6K28_39445 [Microcoleus sp. SIO2G3]|nr:hypothetical protein [Microcoleus sp. SIO2G3]
MRSFQSTPSDSTTAITISQPVIEQIGGEARSLLAGEPLVIRGKHLQGTMTRIRLGGRSKLLSP